MTWRQIYAAEDWVREHVGAPRPFATERFWTDPRDIYTRYEDRFIAASLGGQYPFTELIEERLLPIAGLTFNEEGIADSWTLLPIREVLLKPSVQFGAPCVRKTRIPTKTIWEMHEGGDSPGFIARVYELELKQVEEAIEWEERLAAA